MNKSPIACLLDLTNICQAVVAAAVLLRTMKESRLVLNGKVIQLKETRREIRVESQFLRLRDTHPMLDVSACAHIEL